MSIIGQCYTCCECAAPYLALVTRSASKSKASCAFHSTVDGKYYKNYFSSYTSVGTCGINPAYPAGFSADASWSEVNSTTAAASCSGSVVSCTFIANSNESFSDPPPSYDGSAFTYTAFANDTGSTISTGITTGCTAECTQASGIYTCEKSFLQFNDPQTYTWANYIRLYDSGIGLACTETTSSVLTYTNEYTTDQLKTDAVAQLPAWGAFDSGSAYCSEIASAELNPSGSSYSIQEGKYFFLFQIPNSFQYQISWVEVFIPDSGSGVIQTPRTFSWTGGFPHDYNPATSSTWPVSPTYELDAPDSNGVWQLASMSYSCGFGSQSICT